MTIALSIANGRIAPVFDVAGRVLIIPTEASSPDGGIPPEAAILVLPADASAAGRVLYLARNEVQVLICGAISWPAHELALSRGMEVRAFVAGDAETIFRAWRHDRLNEPDFAMPGCRGRTYWRRHPFADGEQEDLMKGKGQGGRGMGRGGGQGMGQGRGQCGGQGLGQGRKTGQGSGQNGPQVTREPGICRCPECGHTTPHQRALPCVQHQCPACGAVMVQG